MLIIIQASCITYIRYRQYPLTEPLTYIVSYESANPNPSKPGECRVRSLFKLSKDRLGRIVHQQTQWCNLGGNFEETGKGLVERSFKQLEAILKESKSESRHSFFKNFKVTGEFFLFNLLTSLFQYLPTLKFLLPKKRKSFPQFLPTIQSISIPKSVYQPMNMAYGTTRSCY